MVIEACIIGNVLKEKCNYPSRTATKKNVEKPKELRKLIETRIAVARNMH
jgi:hypothetical protein